MKNLKKLSRKELEQFNGAGPSTCGGCPQHATYGNGPNDYSCDTFHALPTRCKMCVIVSSECMDGGVS